MRRFFMAIWLLGLLLPSIASAQTNALPAVTWGPSLAGFTIREDETGDIKFLGFQDFGMSAKFYPWRGDDGSFAVFGLELPFYPKIDGNDFALEMGGGFNLFNGLLGIVATVPAINTASDRGFLVGDVKPNDVAFRIIVGFNLTNGEPQIMGAGARKPTAGTERAPFNCVGW